MNTSETLRKPWVIALICVVLGFGLGLFWGWVVSPVEWTDATPESLRHDIQQDYLTMTIDSYTVNHDAALAQQRYAWLGAEAPTILAEISPTIDPTIYAEFTQVVAATPVAPPPEETAGGRSLFMTLLIVLAVLVILGVIAFGLYYLLRSGSRGPKSPAQEGAEYSRSVAKTDFAAAGQEAPVSQFVTTYVLGDDLFDDSFSIDSPAGEFLGECGVGISETVGVGDPKKVSAFEVWMFDKNDIQTVTQVLMTRHAFEDPAVRAKLESKGELVLMEPGKQVVLETATLQLVALIADLQYGEGALPPESFTERLSLELAVWQKAA
jgi:hypothetical protein